MLNNDDEVFNRDYIVITYIILCSYTILLHLGEWNDVHCAKNQAYICKKSTSAAPVIQSPTPYPIGGCANGFKPAPGGSKYTILSSIQIIG